MGGRYQAIECLRWQIQVSKPYFSNSWVLEHTSFWNLKSGYLLENDKLPKQLKGGSLLKGKEKYQGSNQVGFSARCWDSAGLEQHDCGDLPEIYLERKVYPSYGFSYWLRYSELYSKSLCFTLSGNAGCWPSLLPAYVASLKLVEKVAVKTRRVTIEDLFKRYNSQYKEKIDVQTYKEAVESFPRYLWRESFSQRAVYALGKGWHHAFDAYTPGWRPRRERKKLLPDEFKEFVRSYWSEKVLIKQIVEESNNNNVMSEERDDVDLVCIIERA